MVKSLIAITLALLSLFSLLLSVHILINIHYYREVPLRPLLLLLFLLLATLALLLALP